LSLTVTDSLPRYWTCMTYTRNDTEGRRNTSVCLGLESSPSTTSRIHSVSSVYSAFSKES